jgi:hypothetical protein
MEILTNKSVEKIHPLSLLQFNSVEKTTLFVVRTLRILNKTLRVVRTAHTEASIAGCLTVVGGTVALILNTINFLLI